MPMYSLIEYSYNYSKTPGSLWQYYRDKPDLDNNDNIIDFTDNDIIDSFKLKEIITDQTGDGGTLIVEMMVPFKYLSNYWRALEMLLLTSKFSLILTWSENSVISSNSASNQQHLQ